VALNKPMKRDDYRPVRIVKDMWVYTVQIN